MNDESKEKLASNVANSYKMASNWVFTAVGALGAIWLALPPDQQQTIIAHLPVPAWVLPIVGTVVGVVARLWPQANLQPNDAPK